MSALGLGANELKLCDVCIIYETLVNAEYMCIYLLYIPCDRIWYNREGGRYGLTTARIIQNTHIVYDCGLKTMDADILHGLWCVCVCLCVRLFSLRAPFINTGFYAVKT